MFLSIEGIIGHSRLAGFRVWGRTNIYCVGQERIYGRGGIGSWPPLISKKKIGKKFIRKNK
jgi:hypothetical protein